MVSAEAVSIVLLVLVFACIATGFVFGERENHVYPERWRHRARYLRWLSMACLAAMALLVAQVVAIQQSSQTSSSFGSSVVLGLLAAVLAAVYRYIVRLAYFYEARADAADLMPKGPNKELDLTTHERLIRFALLCQSLSPDQIEYPKAEDVLGGLLKITQKNEISPDREKR
jgi:hypothetical protein